jgi:hypothetical protein
VSAGVSGMAEAFRMGVDGCRVGANYERTAREWIALGSVVIS